MSYWEVVFVPELKSSLSTLMIIYFVCLNSQQSILNFVCRSYDKTAILLSRFFTWLDDLVSQRAVIDLTYSICHSRIICESLAQGGSKRWFYRPFLLFSYLSEFDTRAGLLDFCLILLFCRSTSRLVLFFCKNPRKYRFDWKDVLYRPPIRTSRHDQFLNTYRLSKSRKFWKYRITLATRYSDTWEITRDVIILHVICEPVALSIASYASNLQTFANNFPCKN